jgi:hypothetical protein
LARKMCYAMKNYTGNRNISWEPVLHKNYKGMYKRNISWEPVLHKNYKGMYKRNISWEPVLHKNYKECIREISPGNQYFIKTIKNV